MIIDVIQRKRQVVEETGGVNTVMIREEYEDMETTLLAGVRSADTQCSHEEERSHYTRTHWVGDNRGSSQNWRSDGTMCGTH